MPVPDRVSAVLYVHDSFEETLASLQALERSQPAVEHFELVIVDDASSDSTPDLLGQLEGAVTALRNDEPVGAVAGWRQALQAASADMVLLAQTGDRPVAGAIDAALGQVGETTVAAPVRGGGVLTARRTALEVLDDVEAGDVDWVSRLVPGYPSRRAWRVREPGWAGDGAYIVSLDYPIYPTPRYGYERPPHRRLYELLDAGREQYRHRLEQVLGLQDRLLDIPRRDPGPGDPVWVNDLLSGLDTATLYGVIAGERPRRYLEIGSGYSTRIVRRAIRDFGLDTTITSIDPQPRADVDAICDLVIRAPFEDVESGPWADLEPGDVVFLDGSHRVFQNGDVAVFFCEVLPELAPGVLVHIHDIWWPFDYPPEWIERSYSEQYVLAAWLLAAGEKVEVLLPNAFIAFDDELKAVLQPLWDALALPELWPGGDAFWFRMRP